MRGQYDRPQLWSCSQLDDHVPKLVALEIHAVFVADEFNLIASGVLVKWRGRMAHQASGEFCKFRGSHSRTEFHPTTYQLQGNCFREDFRRAGQKKMPFLDYRRNISAAASAKRRPCAVN